MSDSIFLGSLAHERIRPLLEQGVPVYLSVNPVEYHGPHLPLDTDALISDGLTHLTHARLGSEITKGLPPVFADPIPYGSNPAPGPGTENTHYLRLRFLVLSRCRALLKLGVQRVILTTFHGGPFHNLALWDGVRFLESRGVQAVAPFNLILTGMANYNPSELREVFASVADPVQRAELAERFTADYHAGFGETSLLLHFEPEAVSPRHLSLPPCAGYLPHPAIDAVERIAKGLGFSAAARELHFLALGLAWSRLKPFPGYSGWPHLANPASGAVFAEVLADRYIRAIRGVFLEGKLSPPPTVRFLKALTLGGLLAP